MSQGGILLPHEASAAASAGQQAASAAGGAAPARPFMLGPDNADQPLQLRGRTADGAAAAAVEETAKRKRRRGREGEDAGEDAAFLDGKGFGEALPPLGNGLPDGGAAAAMESSEEEEVRQ